MLLKLRCFWETHRNIKISRTIVITNFLRPFLSRLRPECEIFACVSVFLYEESFPIKMNATDAKTQKIEPDPIFL